MAIWRITIEKFLNAAQEYWTNVYHCDVAGGTEALAVANQLVTLERHFHLSNVVFTKARVDDNTANTDVYDTFSINLAGQYTPSGDLFPLFNVVRVDFNTAGSGSPSRKYYRGVLSEGVAGFSGIAAQTITDVKANTDDMCAISGLCDVDGQDWIDSEVWPFVAMRQLRRGSKKKNTPSSPTPV